MVQPDLIPILKNNPWFAAIGQKQFDVFAELGTLETYPAGVEVFKEGGENKFLCLLLEGRLSVEMHVPTKGRITLLSLGPTDAFGWSSLIPVMDICTATIRAVTKSRAISWPADDLIAACEADHELGYQVYRRITNVIAKRLVATRMQLIDIYAVGTEGD